MLHEGLHVDDSARGVDQIPTVVNEVGIQPEIFDGSLESRHIANVMNQVASALNYISRKPLVNPLQRAINASHKNHPETAKNGLPDPSGFSDDIAHIVRLINPTTFRQKRKLVFCRRNGLGKGPNKNGGDDTNPDNVADYPIPSWKINMVRLIAVASLVLSACAPVSSADDSEFQRWQATVQNESTATVPVSGGSIFYLVKNPANSAMVTGWRQACDNSLSPGDIPGIGCNDIIEYKMERPDNPIQWVEDDPANIATAAVKPVSIPEAPAEVPQVFAPSHYFSCIDLQGQFKATEAGQPEQIAQNNPGRNAAVLWGQANGCASGVIVSDKRPVFEWSRGDVDWAQINILVEHAKKTQGTYGPGEVPPESRYAPFDKILADHPVLKRGPCTPIPGLNYKDMTDDQYFETECGAYDYFIWLLVTCPLNPYGLFSINSRTGVFMNCVRVGYEPVSPPIF